MTAHCPIAAAPARRYREAPPHVRYAGRDLLEKLQPFPGQAVFELGEAGDIAARPRQARDEAGADRIDRLGASTIGTVRLTRCTASPAPPPATIMRLAQARPVPRPAGEDAQRRPATPAMVEPQVAADRSIPTPAIPAGTPPYKAALADHRRAGSSARRRDARVPAHARRAATLRRATQNTEKFPPPHVRP